MYNIDRFVVNFFCVLCCRRRRSTVCYSNADAWISHTRIGAFPVRGNILAKSAAHMSCTTSPAAIDDDLCRHVCAHVCVCLLGEVGCLSFGYNIKRLSVSELNFSAASCVVFGFGVVCRVGGDMLCAYHL